MRLRTARPDDVPALEALIADSARGLSGGHYTPAQIESLLQYVFGVDTQLIADGTYYVCEDAGRLAAAGGWSRRRTLYGGDRMNGEEDPLLDPGSEPARIRAFFVHPDFARRGLGRQLLERCLSDTRAAGFRELTLVASLPGEPLYRALGFEVTRRFLLEMPDGAAVEASEMARPAAQPLSASRNAATNASGRSIAGSSAAPSMTRSGQP